MVRFHQISHFCAYSKKVILKYELVHHYTRVEDGNANWKLYWLPVINGGAEPQEGGR